jgi:ATP-dependent DNA helicase RecG
MFYPEEKIREILLQLSTRPAKDFEDEYLDFKEWPIHSNKEGVHLAVKMTICFANAKGGTAVFGIKNSTFGYDKVILGVPESVDEKILKKNIFEQTSPNHEVNIQVIEFMGKRIVLIRIPEAVQKYISDSGGRYSKRIGSDCMSITGAMLSNLAYGDITAKKLEGLTFDNSISLSAMERIRTIIRVGDAPKDLLKLSNEELCQHLRIMDKNKVTLGGLLIAGKSEVLEDKISAYSWAYCRMVSDTEYMLREEGTDDFLYAIERLMELIRAANPIMTVRDGFFHYEFPTFPEVALREALLNALGHQDFASPMSMMVKHFKDRIEISNPGKFPSGITKENILHYGSVPRNPHLFDILSRLRLVNKSNIGVPRIFHELLSEGKEPPDYEDSGGMIRLTFFGQRLNEKFRKFVHEQQKNGLDLGVDDLLILHYLQRHPEIDASTARKICHQRPETHVRELLSSMERGHLIQHRGAGRGTVYLLSMEVYNALKGELEYERDMKLEKEYLKARILQILKTKNLTNAQIRTITGLERYQVVQLMKSLKEEGHVLLHRQGRKSYWGKTTDGEM